MRTSFVVLIALLASTGQASTEQAPALGQGLAQVVEKKAVKDDLNGDDSGDEFVMIKGKNGKVLSFSQESNNYGNKMTKQAKLDRKNENQRFVLDSRTNSIRPFHNRQYALTLQGNGSNRAVMSPFRNNNIQKFESLKLPQLRL